MDWDHVADDLVGSQAEDQLRLLATWMASQLTGADPARAAPIHHD